MEVVSLRNSPPILPDRHPSHSSTFSIPTKSAFSVRGGRAHFLARSRAVRDRNLPVPEKQKDNIRRRRWIAEKEDELEGLEAGVAKFSAEEDQEEESVSESDSSASDSSASDSSASFLSLSMKSDINMALLDDYEMEELAFDTHPNHQSGCW